MSWHGVLTRPLSAIKWRHSSRISQHRARARRLNWLWSTRRGKSGKWLFRMERRNSRSCAMPSQCWATARVRTSLPQKSGFSRLFLRAALAHTADTSHRLWCIMRSRRSLSACSLSITSAKGCLEIRRRDLRFLLVTDFKLISGWKRSIRFHIKRNYGRCTLCLAGCRTAALRDR